MAMEHVEQTGAMATLLPPGEIIALATAQADALMDVVEKQHLYEQIGQKKHLLAEAWATIGAFNQVAVIVDWVRPFEQEGPIAGYRAKVDLYQNGAIVSTGIMTCGLDEYPCQGKQGQAKHRSAMSAAQTWAMCKAYRLRFSWIAVLAGYSGAPAEEMYEHTDKDRSGGRRTDRATGEIIDNGKPAHPWLSRCPLHDKPWSPGSNSKRSWFSHQDEDGSYCYRAATVNSVARKAVGDAASTLGWTDRKTADWVKGEFRGETFSKLDEVAQITGMETITALAAKHVEENKPEPVDAVPADAAPGSGEQAEDAKAEATAPATQALVIDNLSDLLDACAKIGVDSRGIIGVVGVDSVDDITDFAEVYALVAASLEPPK